MTTHARFFHLLTLAIALAMLVLLGVACSKGGGAGPLLPATETDEPFSVAIGGQSSNTGRVLLGVATVYFDPVAGTAEIRYHRSLEAHLNLTSYLTNSNCPNHSCLTWYIKGHDTTTNIWSIDMNLVNPTNKGPYDLRIIFAGLPGAGTEKAWQVKNPDSYTNNWDTDPVNWDEEKIDKWMNPFIAYQKGSFARRFAPDPDGSGPKLSSDTQPLQMYIPPGAPGGDISLIVDASFPSHCYEPYQILKMSQSDPLPPANDSSTVYFECVIADWQVSVNENDITEVSLYMPDIIDGTDGPYIEMAKWPTTGPKKWPPAIDPMHWTPEMTQFYLDYVNFARILNGKIDFPTIRKFYCNITNDQEVPKGDYPGYIIAKSDDPDGQNYDTLYNRFTFKVGSSGTGGDPTKNPCIIFSSYRNGNADLYYYTIIGGACDKLSNDKTQGEVHSDELEVCVNKANTQIAFISNWNKVPTPGMGDFEIYVAPLQFIGGVPRLLNPDTTDWKQLTTNTRDDRSPDFSPNGGTIAYATKINGQFDIYTVLTGTPGAPFRVTASYANDEAPAYDRMSPLGTKLYYMSNRAGGGNYEIFYINPTQQESSFNLPVRITFNAGFDGYPASSLAGDLAFATETWGASEIMRYNGVDFFRLTENNAIDTYPSYSPDGKWITFMSNRVDTQFDIFRMPYDGGDATRLTNNSAPDIDPYYGGQP